MIELSGAPGRMPAALGRSRLLMSKVAAVGSKPSKVDAAAAGTPRQYVLAVSCEQPWFTAVATVYQRSWRCNLADVYAGSECGLGLFASPGHFSISISFHALLPVLVLQQPSQSLSAHTSLTFTVAVLPGTPSTMICSVLPSRAVSLSYVAAIAQLCVVTEQRFCVTGHARQTLPKF